MTVLLFFFNLLHWSCFVSLSQGLPHIDALRMESEIEANSVAGKINALIPMNHNLHQVCFLKSQSLANKSNANLILFLIRFNFLIGVFGYIHCFKVVLDIIVDVLPEISISTRCCHFQLFVLHPRW